MNYNDSFEAFKNYILNCREQIANMIYSENDLKNAYQYKIELVKSGKINPNATDIETMIAHRNHLIDIKLNHTMRIVEDSIRIANKIGTDVNFDKVLKVAALLHDIARFDQAVWSNDFNDKNCAYFNGMNHAEFGYHILYVNQRIKDFYVPNKYSFIISSAVRYHQLPNLKDDLALRFHFAKDLDVEKIITGSSNLNDQEKVILASLVQIVKDVDMLDILYQHLTGEYPVIRPYIVKKVDNGSFDEISKKYGVSIEELMEFNKLKDLSDAKTIKIPTANMDVSALKVPEDIRAKVLNNEELDLRELMSRDDWSFIVGMWWRLSHFLGQIQFVSNLELIAEKELLDKIYNQYPDNYKPLVKEVFDYAKTILLQKTIEDNKDEIYIDRIK